MRYIYVKNNVYNFHAVFIKEIKQVSLTYPGSWNMANVVPFCKIVKCRWRHHAKIQTAS